MGSRSCGSASARHRPPSQRAPRQPIQPKPIRRFRPVPRTDGGATARIRSRLQRLTSATTFITPADGGRFRLNVDGRVSWEIFNDFVIGFNVTERYDTEPPSADAGRDFHYAVTIGWGWG